MTIGVGVYGLNGHQIHEELRRSARGRLVAAAACDPARLPPEIRDDPRIRHHATLAELLRDDAVQLVSLCSPRRADQAEDAIACLRAGRHVYAEKPAALGEADLDRILAEAARAGRSFHEMAGTAFAQPYWAMRAAVRAGAIGRVVQVLAQKSYPYHDGRPRDEGVDGGLLRQAGVHGARFVEHVAGLRVAEVEACQTALGAPADGGPTMAASVLMRCEGGAIATLIANYLNPHRGTGVWGYEELRIFGERGLVESMDGGRRTRLVVGDRDLGPLDVAAPAPDFLELLLASLAGGAPMPFSLEEELHPTRVVLRARRAAERWTQPAGAGMRSNPEDP